MITTTAKVDISRYRSANLRAPRGRSVWFFTRENGDIMASMGGSYGDTKKHAVKAAKDLGLTTIYVKP